MAKRRKVSMSFTIEPEIVEFINNSVQGKSFSHKISIIFHEWITFKNSLVMYEDNAQVKSGDPTIINPNATRIYSCSAFFYGWDVVNCKYLDDLHEVFQELKWNLKRLPKSERLVTEKFLPLIRAKGYDVQIVDEPHHDIYDIWIAPEAISSKANCSKCKHLINIRNYVEDALRDVEENVILQNLISVYDERLTEDAQNMYDEVKNGTNN